MSKHTVVENGRLNFGPVSTSKGMVAYCSDGLSVTYGLLFCILIDDLKCIL